MKKSIAISIATCLSLLPFAANAQEIKDSINHLLSEQELAEFCAYSGNSGNTRFKIRLPNGTDIYGTVSCRVAE
ncbi:MAG: hypothetical protein L3J13_06295 [Devosiaceae bacterium]|nr:hypothetical protein [Devosiaceae bacterium]